MTASTDLVVEARGLRKRYGRGRRGIVAVDGLDLTVARGGVHGFLGPNGSGKTTTIRLLLGLARPDAGEIRLFGEPVAEGPLRKVGALVDGPRFAADISGRRNLRLLAGLAGLPNARVDEALERVGLSDRAGDRYAGYSAGMRQRLGVAAALLKEPELLILDEPSNGLDPAGILAMRELIRSLGSSGVTVLLSSHILAEVQQVCTSVSIVGDGTLLASGTVEDLLGERAARTRVEVPSPDAAATHLSAAGYTVSRDGGSLLVEGHEHPEQITKVLAAQGIFVSELSAVRPDLEAFFLKLTGHKPPLSPDPAVRAADDYAEHLGEPPHPPADAEEDGA